jgi:hypothetical protein
MPKVANYEIAELIKTQTPFVNYNATIIATLNADGIYEIVHWETKVLAYNTNTGEIVYLLPNSVSTTTSILVGRIVRSLPRKAVLDYLNNSPELTRYNSKRIYKMLWIV